MNKILIVAVVLDPRYKLEFVVHCIGILYDSVQVEATKTEVMKLLYALYNQYKGCHRSKNGASGSGGNEYNDRVTLLEGSDDDDDWDDCNFDFGYKKIKTSKMDFAGKYEVQRYLMEPIEDATDENFNILKWWKINSSKFEFLSKVARDVLAIPVSMVAFESVFSTGRHILDPFRSSLTPKTVDALICTQNWLMEESRPLRVSEDRVCIKEIEFYESIETGKLVYKELPIGLCSFSIASSGKQCLLETYTSVEEIWISNARHLKWLQLTCTSISRLMNV
ncbi:zinc finger BED domain-containing RICESLEEPER 2-like [Olea europaea subsp. europaea]|uniref:Zinc finger BED domain-containing RICESLEEPER 2-like n=1 Tax=Olea europaea subsp. europaea TaxID=158383 RepID=A0A8S0V7X9_OLEEU|nr:zinc finger BED domain-containing RICESLEEPER 2-like [Olea europaea subsp. europaea]